MPLPPPSVATAAPSAVGGENLHEISQSPPLSLDVDYAIKEVENNGLIEKIASHDPGLALYPLSAMSADAGASASTGTLSASAMPAAPSMPVDLPASAMPADDLIIADIHVFAMPAEVPASAMPAEVPASAMPAEIPASAVPAEVPASAMPADPLVPALFLDHPSPSMPAMSAILPALTMPDDPSAPSLSDDVPSSGISYDPKKTPNPAAHLPIQAGSADPPSSEPAHELQTDASAPSQSPAPPVPPDPSDSSVPSDSPSSSSSSASPGSSALTDASDSEDASKSLSPSAAVSDALAPSGADSEKPNAAPPSSSSETAESARGIELSLATAGLPSAAIPVEVKLVEPVLSINTEQDPDQPSSARSVIVF
jgi:hypothetical protein